MKSSPLSFAIEKDLIPCKTLRLFFQNNAKQLIIYELNRLLSDWAVIFDMMALEIE